MRDPAIPPMALSLLFGVMSCLVALVAGYPFVRLLRAYRVGKAKAITATARKLAILVSGVLQSNEGRHCCRPSLLDRAVSAYE